MQRQCTRRGVGATVLAAVVVLGGCGSEGVPRAEHDLVLSELTVANQELALAQEQLEAAVEDLTGAERRAEAAVEDQRAAERRVDELEDELDELFTVDASEEEVMNRQQSLGVLGTLFVEFRNGEWSGETIAMFGEFVDATGDEALIQQLDAFAAAVAADPTSEAADYEYGLLGYEIMAALEREVVDPFGR